MFNVQILLLEYYYYIERYSFLFLNITSILVTNLCNITSNISRTHTHKLMA